VPQGVACGVSNCAYWAEGNRCVADKITIEIDARSKKNWDQEFAEEIGRQKDTQDKAPDSSATCCLTFRPRQKK